jgi:hypothetical protein
MTPCVQIDTSAFRKLCEKRERWIRQRGIIPRSPIAPKNCLLRLQAPDFVPQIANGSVLCCPELLLDIFHNALESENGFSPTHRATFQRSRINAILEESNGFFQAKLSRV